LECFPGTRTLSITALSIKGLYHYTECHHDECLGKPSASVLCIVFLICYTEYHYTDCSYAESHYPECHHDE